MKKTIAKVLWIKNKLIVLMIISLNFWFFVHKILIYHDFASQLQLFDRSNIGFNLYNRKKRKIKKNVYYFEGMKFCSCRYNLHVNNSQIKLLVQDDQRRKVIIGFTNLVETLSLPILFYFLLSNITQHSRSK